MRRVGALNLQFLFVGVNSKQQTFEQKQNKKLQYGKEKCLNIDKSAMH